MISIKKIVKALVPSKRFLTKLGNLNDSYLFITAPIRHRRAIRKLRKKTKIKVAFFVLHSSIWKCDELYKKMEADEKFEPIVIICPYMAFGEDIMHKEMNVTYNFFFQKNYNVLKTYNSDTGKWLDVKNEINPDIIFFTNPHEITRKEYYIRDYLDNLTCYVPYTFQVSNLYMLQYNRIFHNLLWKAFYQTPIHKKIAIKYARNKGRNVVISGYPGIDVFVDKSYLPFDKWKIKDRNIKRIIWAPHHTFGDDSLSYSNFIKYHQVMLDIAEKYSGSIQIAFKPHPILRPKLGLENGWGEEKTNEYYLKWNNIPNGQIEESDYIDLFLTSDAMIHDSASFLAEYLAVNKPVLFMVRDKNIKERLNEFGVIALEQHYLAHSEDDIYDFIENIVINGNDWKRNQREAFCKNYMISPGNVSATNNIFNEIVREL
jgi:hypothetical protein